MKPNAIVFLGYHGSGKDTCANHLIETIALDKGNIGNVKFSQLSKQLSTSALGFRHEAAEDKRLREVEGLGGLSVLDLLNLLFNATNEPYGAKLREANLKYTIETAKCYTVPVFTDIRRETEFNAVYDAGYFPLVICLEGGEIQEGDQELAGLAFEHGDFYVKAAGKQPLENTLDEVLDLVCKHLELTKRKPTLTFAKAFWDFDPDVVISSPLPFTEGISPYISKPVLLGFLSQATGGEFELALGEPKTRNCVWIEGYSSYLDVFRRKYQLKFLSKDGIAYPFGFNEKEVEVI